MPALCDLAFEVAVAIDCMLKPRLRSWSDNSDAVDSNVLGLEHIRLIWRAKLSYPVFHVFRTKGLKPVFPSNKPVHVFGVICRFTSYTISDRYQLVFDILLTERNYR